MNIIKRRLSRVAAFAAVLLLMFSTISFADDSIEEIPPAPENDTEAITETEPEIPEEDLQESAEETEEQVPEPVEFPQDDEPVIEEKPAEQPSEPEIVPESKDSFELAKERLSGRKGIVNLSDMIIPENQEEALMAYLFSQGTFDSDVQEISFYSKGGYIAYCEIDPIDGEEGSNKTSVAITKVVTKDDPEIAETVSAEQEMTEEIEVIPPEEDEEGTEEPTGSFFCTLIIIIGGATKLIHFLI